MILEEVEAVHPVNCTDRPIRSMIWVANSKHMSILLARM